MIDKNEADNGRENRSINRTRGSILGDSCSFVEIRRHIPQDLVCENSILHKSIMRKMRNKDFNDKLKSDTGLDAGFEGIPL